jgi:hypothetical protein
VIIVFCDECGTPAREGSKFCLNCGSEFPSVPLAASPPPDAAPPPDASPPPPDDQGSKKKRAGGFFASAPGIALVVVITALLIAGIVSGTVLLLRNGTDNKKETVTEQTSSSTKPEETASTANKVYSVGETAKSGDLAITVYGYKLVSDAKDIAVDVGIENKGTKTETISAKTQMSMRDPDGKVYGVAPFVPESPFPEGELQAGQTARGWIAFEFPASGKAEFVFDSGTGEVVRFK